MGKKLCIYNNIPRRTWDIVHIGHEMYNTNMTRLVKFTPGEFFHIYNRGTNKMNIFTNHFDYSRFQKLLYAVNSKDTLKLSDIERSKVNPCPTWVIDRGETLVEIGAYCLMPNHFHLLIRSKDEKNTGTFLQRLLTSHSKYFNTKYDRSGSLFQGKSKAEHVVGDNYLKYIFSYIHLNPVKIIQRDWKENGITNIEEVKKYLSEYKYSSFRDFAGEKRRESKILELSNFPNYFSTKEDYIDEIIEWLNYNNNEKS